MNKRPTLITQTIAGIKSNYCLSLKIISKNSRQISTSITQLYTCVEIYFKSPKRNQEMYFITLQYYQASVKFSRPLVSSFQCRCLSLDHLSPVSWLLNYTTFIPGQPSDLSAGCAGPCPAFYHHGAAFCAPNFPSRVKLLWSQQRLTRRRLCSLRWPRLATEDRSRVDDREREREGERERWCLVNHSGRAGKVFR